MIIPLREPNGVLGSFRFSTCYYLLYFILNNLFLDDEDVFRIQGRFLISLADNVPLIIFVLSFISFQYYFCLYGRSDSEL